jgi:hypothetical protein
LGFCDEPGILSEFMVKVAGVPVNVPLPLPLQDFELKLVIVIFNAADGNENVPPAAEPI